MTVKVFWGVVLEFSFFVMNSRLNLAMLSRPQGANNYIVEKKLGLPLEILWLKFINQDVKIFQCLLLYHDDLFRNDLANH